MSKTKSTQGSHLEAFLYRAPKKNRDAVAQNLKKFVPWFEKHGVGIAYYRLGDSRTMEGMEDVATTISATKDEDIWMEIQYFRDRKHSDEVYKEMMKDKELEALATEFFSLVTQGKSLIAGSFDRLEE